MIPWNHPNTYYKKLYVDLDLPQYPSFIPLLASSPWRIDSLGRYLLVYPIGKMLVVIPFLWTNDWQPMDEGCKK